MKIFERQNNFKNHILPDAIKANAKDELYGLQHGRFKVLRGVDRSYPICRLHGRPVSVRPKFLVKRHPLRLLMDYGEGMWFSVFFGFFITRYFPGSISILKPKKELAEQCVIFINVVSANIGQIIYEERKVKDFLVHGIDQNLIIDMPMKIVKNKI